MDFNAHKDTPSSWKCFGATQSQVQGKYFFVFVFIDQKFKTVEERANQNLLIEVQFKLKKQMVHKSNPSAGIWPSHVMHFL